MYVAIYFSVLVPAIIRNGNREQRISARSIHPRKSGQRPARGIGRAIWLQRHRRNKSEIKQKSKATRDDDEDHRLFPPEKTIRS